MKKEMFILRFLNYQLGDDFYVLMPTITLIAVVLLFCLIIFLSPALWFRHTQRERAKIFIQEENLVRERKYAQIGTENIHLRKRVKHLERELNRSNKFRTLIREAGETMESVEES